MHRERKISLLLIIALMLVFAITAFADDATSISAKDAEGKTKTGSTVRVEVNADTDISYANGIITVTWDSNVLELQDIEYNDELAPNNGSQYDEETGNLLVTEDGVYNVSFGADLNKEDFSGKGVLFTLVFQVKPGAEEGEYIIGLKKSDKTDFYSNTTINVDGKLLFEKVEVDISSGKVILHADDIMFGDVNGDGKVNRNDLVKILRYFAKYADAQDINKENADVDHNGVLNRADLTKIQKYFAKLITSFD